MAHPISLKFILTLLFHRRLGPPNNLFPSAIITNIPYAFLFAPMRATCPYRLIRTTEITPSLHLSAGVYYVQQRHLGGGWGKLSLFGVFFLFGL
jgi:hypothetical protein